MPRNFLSVHYKHRGQEVVGSGDNTSDGYVPATQPDNTWEPPIPVPEPPACPVYNPIYMPVPTSVTLVNGAVMPRAVGMPVVENQKMGGYLMLGDYGGAVEKVPGIAPGSTDAYKLNSPPNTLAGAHARFRIFATDQRVYPKWQEATYMKFSFYVQPLGINSTFDGPYFSIGSYWKAPSSDRERAFYLGANFADHPSLRWRTESATDGAGLNYYYNNRMPLLDAVEGKVDGQVYAVSLSLTSNNILTLSINGVTQSISGNFWPNTSLWTGQSPLTYTRTYPHPVTEINIQWSPASASTVSLVVDQLKVETDVPWCQF